MIDTHRAASASALCSLFLVCVLAALCPAPAAAQPASTRTFLLSVDDRTIEVDTPRQQVDAGPVVSLRPLVETLGGAIRVTEDHIKVDLRNATAWIERDTGLVQSSRGDFVLRGRMYLEDESPWLATPDLVALFDNAFDVTARETARVGDDGDAPTRADAPDAGTGPEFIDMEDLEGPGGPPAEPLEPSLATPPALSRSVRLVLIDPGHGGEDAGATTETLAEKDITFAIASELATLLADDLGVTAHLTRRANQDADLSLRRRVTSEQQPDLIISLHVGASTSPDAFGSMVFYPDWPADAAPAPRRRGEVITRSERERQANLSRRLAEAVGGELTALSDAPGIEPRPAPLRLFAPLTTPGVLVETGFLTNAYDAAALDDPAQRTRIAEAIARGVARYVGGATEPAS
jgi:N-acetylmuramoyl-L-alanine amidase